MTAMTVAGSPWMTMDSCAWSAKEILRSALPGTSSSGSRSCNVYARLGSARRVRIETLVTALAEAIRPSRRPVRHGPPTSSRLSAEQGEQDRDEDGHEDAEHQ